MGIFSALFPETALKRQVAKTKLQAFNYVSGANSGSGYAQHGGNTRKKSLLGWFAKSRDADADIVYNLEILRQRARDLHMGTPLANGAVKTIVTNVVGAGLTLNAQIDYEYLGITLEQANQIERQIEREFNLWAKKSYNCDIAGSNNFYEMQVLAMFSMLMSGDCFVLLPIVKRNGSIYDLKINLLEADRICTPVGESINANILEGVEIDQYGLPIAYHIANKHPYAIVGDGKPIEWVKIPAFGSKSGRRNVLHLFTSERPMQRRGLPLLSPVLEMFKQLGRYSDAEIMAAVVSGMFSVFIKSETPQTPLGAGVPTEERVDQLDTDSLEMGNGSVLALNPGESVEVANPGRPNTAFDPFVTSILRQIGASLEIPYEILIKHFTASYSASRAAILQAWQHFLARRKWLVDNFCQPIYEEWLTEAVAKGRINLPGFFSDQLIKQAWARAEFFGSSIPQIDPLKEVNAAIARVENGFSTRSKEARELSESNFDEIAPIRVREELALDGSRRSQKQTYTGVIDSESLAN